MKNTRAGSLFVTGRGFHPEGRYVRTRRSFSHARERQKDSVALIGRVGGETHQDLLLPQPGFPGGNLDRCNIVTVP